MIRFILETVALILGSALGVAAAQVTEWRWSLVIAFWLVAIIFRSAAGYAVASKMEWCPEGVRLSPLALGLTLAGGVAGWAGVVALLFSIGWLNIR